MTSKTIRFNLMFHNGDKTVQVRSLKDLENNMNINDLYDYFCSGQLERWLAVHGQEEKAGKVSELRAKLQDQSAEDTLFDLIKGLGLDFEDEEINNAIASFTYPQKVMKQRQEFFEKRNSIKNKIKKEFDGYYDLVKSIPSNYKEEESDFWRKTRETVRTILKEYPEQFKLDFMRFFDIMKYNNKFAILAVLLEEPWRDYYLYQKTKKEYIERVLGDWTKLCVDDLRNMDSLISFNSLLEKMFQVKKTNAGYTITVARWYNTIPYRSLPPFILEAKYDQSTDGDWADYLIDPGKPLKKYMILSCKGNIKIRPHKNRLGAKKAEDVQPFEIIEGLEFCVTASQNNSKPELLFMEV